jgi:hypothetical protein
MVLSLKARTRVAFAAPLIIDALETGAIVLHGPLRLGAKAAHALVIDEHGDEPENRHAQPPASDGQGAEAQPCHDQK